MPIARGVPQGSPLSPLLFNIMVRHLPEAAGAPTFQFADDLTNLASSSNVDDLTVKLQSVYENVKTFCSNRYLSINLDKTQVMIFKKPSKKLPEQLSITLDHTPIQVTKTVKLLGVTIDQHFTMGPHIDDTIKKYHGLLGVMKRSAAVLPKDLISLFYQSIVRSHLEYCSTTFLQAANTHLGKLDTLQKIAARIALGMGPQEHSAPLLLRLGWEPLSLRRVEHAKFLVQNIETGKSHPSSLLQKLLLIFTKHLFWRQGVFEGGVDKPHHQRTL